jgi:hypothetical protein
MLTSPLRAAWSDPTISRTPGWGAFFPTLLSATLTAQVVGFMFMYEIAFLRPVIAAAVTVGIPSVLITNLILIGTMLLLLRRWQTPTGSIVLTFGVFAAPLTAIGGFTAWPAILPALAAGLVADLLIRRLGAPEGERNTLRIVPTVTSLTL